MQYNHTYPANKWPGFRPAGGYLSNFLSKTRDGNAKRYFLLYAFFCLCFLEVLPHIEILVQPKIRIFTQQKLIFTVAVFFLFVPLLKGTLGVKLSAIPSISWILAFGFSLCTSASLCSFPEAGFINVARYLGYFIFYALIIIYVRSYKDIETLFAVAMSLCVIAFIVGNYFIDRSILEYANPDMVDLSKGYYSPTTGEYTQRAYVLTWNANTIGYLSAYSMLIVVYFINVKSASQGIIKKLKLPYIFACVFFYFLVTSMSRGAFISFIVAFIIAFAFFRMSLWRLVPFFIIIFVFASVVLSPDLSILRERFLRATGAIAPTSFQNIDLKPDKSMTRIEDALQTWEITMEYPLFGVGFIPPLDLLAKFPSLPASMNHLFYVQMILFTGFIGFALYLILILNIFFKLLSIVLDMKRRGDPHFRMGGTLLAMFMVCLIKAFFGPLLFDLWLIMGLSAAFIRIFTEGRRLRRRQYALAVANGNPASIPFNANSSANLG